MRKQCVTDGPLSGIDPKSTAGVLLREHDDIAQALGYAERKAKTLQAAGNSLAGDYETASAALREELQSKQSTCEVK